MQKPAHIDWVDTAKGMSILMVVLLYAVYSVGEDMGQIGALHYAVGFMTPFRMPDFFAISGLFLARTLDRGPQRFFDRRVVHYAYFYLLWAAIHITVKVALFAGDPALALETFAWSLVAPYGVLWFIYVLALVNTAVWLMQALKVPHWLGLIGAAALQIAPIHTGAYAIDQFAEYFVYFYAGYALAPLLFATVDLGIRHPRLAVAALVMWAYMNGVVVFLPTHTPHFNSFDMGIAATPGLHLIYASLGITALFTLAGLLSRLPVMAWLTWIGRHSLMIYVAFALPMTATRLVVLRSGLIDNPDIAAIIVYAVAVTTPLILYALVQKTGIGRFLFTRPAAFHIDRPRPVRHGSLSPAE